MEILLFLLVSYGISNIVVHGSIFEKMRVLFDSINPKYLGTLVSCMICFPTWVGFGLSYLFHYLGLPFLTPFGNIGLDNMLLAIFLDGCLTSGVVWLIHTLQEYFEK